MTSSLNASLNSVAYQPQAASSQSGSYSVATQMGAHLSNNSSSAVSVSDQFDSASIGNESAPTTGTGGTQALTQAMAQMRTDAQNPSNKTQSQRLSDGRTVLFEKVNGQAQFAIFNADGTQAAPASGWQKIDPSINGGKGTLCLGLGTNDWMNFDTNGMTIDNMSKNVGIPLGYDGSGNVAPGIGTLELTDPLSRPDISSDPSLSGDSSASHQVNLYPSSDANPSSSDIHQTGYGDCYFDSTLASLASSPAGQQAIKNMITPLPNGQYDVAMHAPGGALVHIEVDSSFLSNSSGMQAEQSKDGTANWGTVLEAAWVKYNDMYHTNEQTGGFQGTDGSSNTDAAVFALTGNPGQNSLPVGKMSTDQLNSFFTSQFSTSSISNGAGLTAGSPSEQTLPDGVKVVGPHAYSVIGYDPATQTVTVRNPWGAQDGLNSDGTPTAGDGTIKMSLADFQKAFTTTAGWSGLGTPAS